MISLSNFEEKRETRNRFLRAACDLGENRPLRMVSLENIGAQLSMDASNSTAEDELSTSLATLKTGA